MKSVSSCDSTVSNKHKIFYNLRPASVAGHRSPATRRWPIRCPAATSGSSNRQVFSSSTVRRAHGRVEAFLDHRRVDIELEVIDRQIQGRFLETDPNVIPFAVALQVDGRMRAL